VPECAIWMMWRLCVLCLRHRYGDGHTGFHAGVIGVAMVMDPTAWVLVCPLVRKNA
jgi:hypothetical protein